MAEILKLDTTATDFYAELDQLLAWDGIADVSVNQTVDTIIHTIRTQGDEALVEYTRRFDRWQPQNAAELQVSPEALEQAWNDLPKTQRQALEHAAGRIRTYAEKQKLSSWDDTEEDGTLLGQKITPLDRVGLYAPGGKAAYPSSVLMNAIPAQVAGVGQLIMTTPTPNDEINPMTLAAAHLCGVETVFKIGGAQAIAALAYGTASIPSVDKIVGPGNIYVATAKRAVFGQVGIDMVAGPSEILVICDGKTNPDWVAMDLFSQAEHDEEAQSILLCPDAGFLQQVEASIDKLLPQMQRQQIIQTALRNRGALIHCQDLDQAIEIANHIAPEHLELSIDDAPSYVDRIQHAGAIFIGRHTSEPLGDYCAGPNHVLPTSRTARFSSPLGVYDFQKRTSLIMASPTGADTLGKTAAILAHGEGLQAHALAAEYRQSKP